MSCGRPAGRRIGRSGSRTGIWDSRQEVWQGSCCYASAHRTEILVAAHPDRGTRRRRGIGLRRRARILWRVTYLLTQESWPAPAGGLQSAERMPPSGGPFSKPCCRKPRRPNVMPVCGWLAGRLVVRRQAAPSDLGGAVGGFPSLVPAGGEAGFLSGATGSVLSTPERLRRGPWKASFA